MIRSVESADRRETNRREESLAALGDERGGTGRGRRHERRTRHDGNEPRILIVEDDRAIREPLRTARRRCESCAPSPAPTSSCSICACR
jgi:hypothetical protein